MECPHCGLHNPDTAQRCDCGYDFDTQKVAQSGHVASSRKYETKRSLLMLAASVLASLVLVLLYHVGVLGTSQDFPNWQGIVAIIVLALVAGLVSESLAAPPPASIEADKCREEIRSILGDGQGVFDGMSGATVRDLKEPERAVLEDWLTMKTPPGWHGAAGCLSAMLILAGALALVFGPGWGSAVAGVLVLLSVWTALGWIREAAKWRKGRPAVLRRIREALADGRAEVASFRATRVVVESWEGWEDDVSVCYYDIDAKRVLRLDCRASDPGDGSSLVPRGPRDKAPAEQPDSWPNTCFEVVRTIKHRLWVGVFYSGDALRPMRNIDCEEGHLDCFPPSPAVIYPVGLSEIAWPPDARKQAVRT